MIDSDASSSIIDSDTFDQLAQSKNVYLEPSTVRFYVYNSRNPLELLGSFFQQCQYETINILQSF